MNKTDLVLQKTVLSLYYKQVITFTDKVVKGYTGIELFETMDDLERFMFKNGYITCNQLKYDYELLTGSVTTYAVIKERELYSY